MKDVKFNRFSGGKTKALTLRHDVGREDDRKMVDILNSHNVKGTFHLNSGLLHSPGHVTSNEVPTLYARHEVSCHTVSHARPQHG